MRCSSCSSYIPEGIGLTDCPNCGQALGSAKPMNEKSAQQPNHSPEPPKSNVQTPKESKRRKFVVPAAIIILCLAVVMVISNGTGHLVNKRSYYVDSKSSVGYGGFPENRAYAANGDFYRLIIRYPQDLFAIVGGTETFLTNGQCTHEANLAVVGARDSKIRFRVLSFDLKTAQGRVLEHLNYNQYMTSDILREQGPIKDWKAALRRTAELIPKADFTTPTNTDEIYYGYTMKDPPSSLLLSFEVEIYTLDRARKDRVKDTVELTRVDRDPMEWVRNQWSKK